MDEREIIRYIRSLSESKRYAGVEIGPGDDAACVNAGKGGDIVISTDMLIEGTHFRTGEAPGRVGVKAVGRALSDLAAMAARPLCTLTALSFPRGLKDEYQRELLKSIKMEAERLEAPLVGGDTGSGTDVLLIAVTAVGVPGAGGLIGRGGAVVGDSICVTGALGGSLAGRHMNPQPKIQESLSLAACYDVHALIDISDGLSTDLLHIAEESGVGVELYADKIPIHPDVDPAASRREGGSSAPVHRALNDGEDYELLFCLPPSQGQKIAFAGILGQPVCIIGSVKERSGNSIIWPDGTKTELEDTGWHHLKNK